MLKRHALPIPDECQAFDQWFQDLQLSVNEYFENPEQRQDLEASVEKLAVSCSWF